MMVGQPAPRLWAASVRLWMSMARRPLSTDRYMYGSDSTTYAATSRNVLPRSVEVTGSPSGGPPPYTRMSPNTSTTGGTTNGSSVMNSTTGRIRGTLSRTQ